MITKGIFRDKKCYKNILLINVFVSFLDDIFFYHAYIPCVIYYTKRSNFHDSCNRLIYGEFFISHILVVSTINYTVKCERIIILSHHSCKNENLGLG